MTILFGTDFSENAGRAGRAAAAIAKRLGVGLKLVYVIDEPGAQLSAQGEVHDPARRRAHDQAAQLQTQFGIEVEPLVVPGAADETLIEQARVVRASLIVVSSLGSKKQHRWLVGSVAERVAQASPVPVLVVRDSASFEAWARGDRALRVMVGVELASTSRAALLWAAKLRAIGPVDLVLAQVASPVGELRPEVHDVLMRELRVWAGDLPGEGQTSFLVTAGRGRVDPQLSHLADEGKVDLLVVGTHQRAFVARLWQGSVSRGVLHDASGNVACVPGAQPTEQPVLLVPPQQT